MRVWLVKVGEPMPGPTSGRLLRTQQLASRLAARGHEVTLWASDFQHAEKRHYFGETRREELAPNLRYVAMHSRGYQKNVSFARLLDDFDNARIFGRLAAAEPRPDVVYCAFPSIVLARQVARFAGSRKVPLVIDARDFWPDILLDRFSPRLRPLVRALISSLFEARDETFARATAITGITPEFVDFGLRAAGRQRRPSDRDFPLAYDPPEVEATKAEEAQQFWRSRGLARDPSVLTACYLGTMSKRLVFDTVLDAAELLAARAAPVRFVLCATGDNSREIACRAKLLPNVTTVEWLDQAELAALAQLSDVGLLPYGPYRDFKSTLGNKAAEYMAHGLAMVCSLPGSYTARVIEQHRCGMVHAHDDPEQLASALGRMAADRQMTSQMGQAGRALYEREYRASQVYERMAEYVLSFAKSSEAAKRIEVPDLAGAQSPSQ